MIHFESKGNWDKTRAWIHRLLSHQYYSDLDRYGKMGVEALASATPVETGETRNDWYYVIKRDRRNPRIEWHNDNLDATGTPIVILLQYGHATGTGGYVQGRDFINPAILPVFQAIADDIWKKVTAQ